MKTRRTFCSHSWVVLAVWTGTESCWKIHSWPLKKVMLSCFTAPSSTSFWHTLTQLSPLSCKIEDVVRELLARPSMY
jgi:hypothetical protein